VLVFFSSLRAHVSPMKSDKYIVLNREESCDAGVVYR